MAITEKGRAIGERVKALRVALGLTQEGLAQAGGTGRIAIVHVEHGRNQLSTEAMRTALARGFGLSRDDIGLYLDGEITVRQAKRRSSLTQSKAS